MPRPKRVPDAAVTAEVCGLGLSGSKKKLEPMQIADTMLEVVERNERRFEIKITRCPVLRADHRDRSARAHASDLPDR